MDKNLPNQKLFSFFKYFSKDSHMSKNIVSKNKTNYKCKLLVHKEKNY